MYIVINQITYTDIIDLSFAPEADVTGNSLPINEFQAKIITPNTIAYSQYAYLYNDVNTLFAKYWITHAEREGDAVQIVGKSDIALMDGVALPAVMYSNASISSVLDGIMVRQSGTPGLVATIDYTLATSLQSVTITGYCPEQSARERLQWVCFVAGAYVKAFFNQAVRIQPLDVTETLVPIDKTFWRPTIKHSDYVTAIKVTGFTFTAGEPQTTDEWVQVGNTYYIVTRQEFSLTNDGVPAGTADNIISFDNVYLVDGSNAAGILSYLALLYFRRGEITLDIINNGEYMPGDRLVVYGAEDELYVGYAKSMAFSFGKQSKSTVTLMAVDDVAGAKLTVTYKWGQRKLDVMQYYFPVGYSYSIQTLYLEKLLHEHRYIFRPQSSAVTGTMTSGGKTATVTNKRALDLELETGILEIIHVDSVTTSTSQTTGEVTGVIA